MARARIKRCTCVAVILFCIPIVSLAETITSPFNNKVLDTGTESAQFSFLLIGHPYGTPGLHQSVYPSPSLLANIDLLNDKNPAFIVLLGDIVRKSTRSQMDTLKRSLLLKLAAPVFNAPGNHDLADRELYIEQCGNTFWSFRYSSSQFIFLDSVENRGEISGKQLEFLMECIKQFKDSTHIKNLFIFVHHLLWAIGNPPYSDILPQTNGPGWHPPDALTVTKDILPQLQALKEKNVYFASGDIGVYWSFPLFYQKDPDSNITYMATGLGDTVNDSMIQVNVNDGTVSITPISLTGQTLQPIEEYGVGYWNNHLKQESSAVDRFLKKVLKILRHRYYVLGVSTSGMVFLVILLLVRKKANA